MVFGGEGSEVGQVRFPGAITIDLRGNAIVADHENHRIQWWGPDGKWLRAVGKKGRGNGELMFPWGIALCPTTQSIFVGDTHSNRIVVFHSMSGAFIRNIGEYGQGHGELRHPRGLALDFVGRVVVADQKNGRIQAFWPNGTHSYSSSSLGNGEHQLWYPIGLALLSNGLIVVADYGNHRVQVFAHSDSIT
mmetsp:Transcript_72971/g.118405  ORF Transcript_72971/g.118405 Transcript_72971/m.118405 type:complete len:191 (+) Transcript_72971:41-613(+)